MCHLRARSLWSDLHELILHDPAGLASVESVLGPPCVRSEYPQENVEWGTDECIYSSS